MLKPGTYTIEANRLFEQLAEAQRLMRDEIERLKREGYVYHPHRGCYVSRDGNTEVWIDG